MQNDYLRTQIPHRAAHKYKISPLILSGGEKKQKTKQEFLGSKGINTDLTTHSEFTQNYVTCNTSLEKDTVTEHAEERLCYEFSPLPLHDNSKKKRINFVSPPKKIYIIYNINYVYSISSKHSKRLS